MVVQRSGDMGSPRTSGSTSVSSAVRTAGFRSATRLRPAQGRRMRPNGASPEASSRTPADTLASRTPAARATALIPPRPRDWASAPISRRRCRSSRCGRIASNLAASTARCSSSALMPDQRITEQKATSKRSARPKKKSQAIALGNLTLALIRQGKLDEAAAAMHRTIDAVEMTRGGGGLNLAFSAGRELRQWRQEPWAQEIDDRLLAVMAAI